MPKRGESTAQANKRIRREALIEQLAAKGLVQKVLDTVDKMDDLPDDVDALKLQAMKYATDTRLALIRKYLPDVKAAEISGPNGEPFDDPRSTEEIEAAIERKLAARSKA